MNIQKISVEKLNPAAYNLRKDLKPGDKEYEKLKRSIEEFGYVEPVIWNQKTGNVVGGHQRLKVLLDLGKRRIHGSGDRKYIAWCCTKHIKDASICSMKFVREDEIHQAFVVMINKLIFGNKFILRPLLQSLKKTNYSDNIAKIQELETKIKENTERVQVIMGLMAKGYLEPALFNTQKNELLNEAALLKEQKEAIKRAIDGSQTILVEVEKLLKFATKAEKQIDAFDSEIFENFTREIIVFSQEEIGFKMKCGLNLRERLVK